MNDNAPIAAIPLKEVPKLFEDLDKDYNTACCPFNYDSTMCMACGESIGEYTWREELRGKA